MWDPRGFILLDLERVSSHQLLVLTDQDVLPNVVPQPEPGLRLPEGGRGRLASHPLPTPSPMPFMFPSSFRGMLGLEASVGAMLACWGPAAPSL